MIILANQKSDCYVVIKQLLLNREAQISQEGKEESLTNETDTVVNPMAFHILFS